MFDARFVLPRHRDKFGPEIVPHAQNVVVEFLTMQVLHALIRAEVYSAVDARFPVIVREVVEKFPAIHLFDYDVIASDVTAALVAALRTANHTADSLAILAARASFTASERNTRFLSHYIRTTEGFDAVPLLPRSPVDPAVSVSGARGHVIDLVINALPVPSDETPWREVAQFRRDDSARRAITRLRRWMTEVGASAKTRAEVEDELQSLLDDYVEHMRIARMKCTYGLLRVVVTVAAEIADSLVRLRFKDAADAIFTVKDHQIALLEAERAAPGREVAYIALAWDRFKQRPGT